MLRNFKAVAVFTVAAFFSSCTVGVGSSLSQQVPKSTEESIVLPPELTRVLIDYEAGWKAGDATALARLFTEDGFVLSPVSDMDNSNRRRE